MLSVALTVLALGAPPPPAVAQPLDDGDGEAFALVLNAARGEVAWEVVTADRVSVRRRVLYKSRVIRIGGRALVRGFQWTRAGKPMLNALDEATGRWSIEIGGKEPASPSAASDLHGAVSPDGKQVAFVSGRSGKGDIYLAKTNASNRAPTRLVGSPLPELTPVWSPDGKRLAFLRVTDRGRQGVIIPVAGGAAGGERVVAEERDGPIALSWRPDGKQVAFFGRDWSVGTALYTASADIGPSSKVLGDVRPHPQGPAWLPDGRGGWLLVAIRKDDSIVTLDAIGEATVLKTGTFGHGEVTAGLIKGRRTLVFTALGLTGDEKGPFDNHRVWSWTLP